jgi:ribosomal protein L7Ae-like RNA K-turn-binding protein
MNNPFLQFLGICKKAGCLVEGYNKAEELVQKGKIKLLILSDDASENTIKKFTNYGTKYKFKIIKNFSKEELGSSIGREEIRVIGISDKNMAEKLLSIYEQSINSGVNICQKSEYTN